jgi:OmpA-OmpF porin, OOP family
MQLKSLVGPAKIGGETTGGAELRPHFLNPIYPCEEGRRMRHDGCVTAGWALCSLGLLLAGCSGWSYNPPIPGNPITERGNLAAVREATPQSPTDFKGSLTSDYASLAAALDTEQHDWNDADYFSRKGLAAAEGKNVPPEDNVNWLIPLEVPDKFRTELATSRQHLVAVLDAGARDVQPAVAARAQVSYDCWVERMEFDWHAAYDGPCHKQFVAALNQLENRHAEAVTEPAAQPVLEPSAGAAGPPEAGREYRVYFNFNKYDLLPDGQRLVSEVATQAKQDVNTHITMVGKADLAGSNEYNIALSHRRADTVREALVHEGVPDGQITESWVGDSEPPVPTPSGVHEARNRVVEIKVQ